VPLKKETITNLSEKTNSKRLSPYSLPNVRRFIAFRLFFNSRFYYPVFTILFLDFGLSLDQFALLNSIWAATIVVMEVPSGALADIVGRKRLLVFSAFLMILEMVLICLLPIGKSPWLFPVFALNRVLSGIAEASASGADEALAFDSLVSADLKDQWGRVLEMLMRVQAIGFIIAMSIGAAVYDPHLMQQVADLIHLKIHLTQSVSLRFPLYLTLGMAILTFWITMGMHETDHFNQDNRQTTSIKTAFKLSFSAGGWVLRTPFALTIILAGLIFDSIARMVITLSSQYYRLIDLPEATFGLIGSLVAALGLFVPRLARGLSQKHSPFVNFGITAAVAFSGLFGMTFFLPIIGLIPALVLFGGMQLTSFFVSHYLNQITDSSQRATVLSIKGLSYNLAYGLIGILYSLLVSNLQSDIAANLTSISAVQLQQDVFMAAMQWFPWTFMATLLIFMLYGRWLLIRKGFTLTD
jgi:MFS family permease